MIRSLELVNFRRHERTTLEFGSDSQIIAITGRNGGGKTTILEAVQFCLYGETRHGRRGIAGLVRRGAEHEGMSATMAFDIAGTLFRVERRYEKGKHSAALYANDVLHTQTADGVTKAIGEIVGLDSVGFKAATIANQKELDGLAELTPAVRRKTIARMLRLDAIEAASVRARDVHNRAKTSADALSGSATVAERQSELDVARADLAEAEGAAKEATELVRSLQESLGASASVEAEYSAATLAQARAEATAEAAETEVARLTRDLDAVVVPDVPPMPGVELDAVLLEIADLEQTLVRGQQQEAMAANLATSRTQLADTQSRIELLRAPRDPAAAIEEATQRVLEAEQSLAALKEDRDLAESLIREEGVARSRIATLREQAQQTLRRYEELGASCRECGQDVGEDHKHSLLSGVRDEVAELAEQDEQAQAALNEAEADLAAVHSQATQVRAVLDAAQRDLQGAREVAREISELTRTAEVYREEISRTEGLLDNIDLPAARTRLAELNALRTQITTALHAREVAQRAEERRSDLHEGLTAAQVRLSQAREAAESAAPGAELVEAWRERTELVRRLEEERTFAHACSATAAAAAANVTTATRLLEEAQSVGARAAEFRTQAEVAAKASTLLRATAQRMATQIRPQLEGQVSAMLQMMSEGRFSAVRVSDDYEITVCDHDGSFHPVSEFSGGEADLIALAIRLSLAQVVAARHGAGGAGFLILDEVFGSQDEGRRVAILEALRRLRSTYGQILLISHVGGIEEASDMVLSVRRDDDEELARVSVLT